MVWFWDWHENKFITKIKQGIVFYKKPFNNINQLEIKETKLNRKLETKMIRTHTRK